MNSLAVCILILNYDFIRVYFFIIYLFLFILKMYLDMQALR